MLVALTRPQENQWGIAVGQASYFGLTPEQRASGHLPRAEQLEARLERQAGQGLRDRGVQGDGRLRARPVGGRRLAPEHAHLRRHFNDEFMAGRFAVRARRLGPVRPALGHPGRCATRTARSVPMHPFAHDGGKPYYPAGSGNFGMTYIKQQASPERVKMLLRIADFFAAPFGSEEWLLNYFGVKDATTTFNADGAPVLTEQGRAELTATWRYVTSPPTRCSAPIRSQEFATVSHAAEKAMIAVMEPDPTLGSVLPDGVQPGHHGPGRRSSPASRTSSRAAAPLGPRRVGRASGAQGRRQDAGRIPGGHRSLEEVAASPHPRRGEGQPPARVRSRACQSIPFSQPRSAPPG